MTGRAALGFRTLVALMFIGLHPQSSLSATTHLVPSELYASIQAAVDAASPGDTVLVLPGVYDDFQTRSTPVGTRTACVFLKGGVILRSQAGPDVTTIHMPYSGAQAVIYGVELGLATTAVDGFTISSVPIFSSAMRVLEAGLVEVRNCHFSELFGSGTASGLLVEFADVLVEGCSFTDCVGPGSGAALYSAQGDLTLRDTTFQRCTPFAVDLNFDTIGSSALIEDCQFLDCEGTSASTILAFTRLGGRTIRRCIFADNVTTGSGGTVELQGAGPSLVEDCLFLNNELTANGSGGGVALAGSGFQVVRGCTFYGNSQLAVDGGSAVSLEVGTGRLENNIFAACGTVPPIRVRSGANLGASVCNVFWDNEAGNEGVGYAPGPTDREVDPQFCDSDQDDFRVRPSSPCVEPGALGCGQIGAYGVGCGTVSVETMSWGRLKGSFR